MINPNEYIRIGYLEGFTALAVPSWSKRIPKNIKPTPSTYVLISSQTKNPTEENKEGFEWLCTVNIDIVNIMPQGYSDVSVLDRIEESIINIVQGGLNFPGFVIKSADLVDSIDLDLETTSQSIERRILIYQHWLNNIDG